MNRENKKTLRYLFNSIKNLDDDDIEIVFEGITQAYEYILKSKFPDEYRKFKLEEENKRLN